MSGDIRNRVSLLLRGVDPTTTSYPRQQSAEFSWMLISWKLERHYVKGRSSKSVSRFGDSTVEHSAEQPLVNKEHRELHDSWKCARRIRDDGGLYSGNYANFLNT